MGALCSQWIACSPGRNGGRGRPLNAIVRQMRKPSSATGHSDARFKRTVERIGAEAYWLRTYQNAINGMKGVNAIGLDFFRVSLSSLKDARLVRLIRVLESDPRTASFWYLHLCNPGLVQKAAKAAGLDLVELQAISQSLVPIRTKTFMHIDKDGVFDPQALYKAAGLNNDKVEDIIRRLEQTMRNVHASAFGEEPQGDDYTGADIKELARLRDEASA